MGMSGCNQEGRRRRGRKRRRVDSDVGGVNARLARSIEGVGCSRGEEIDIVRYSLGDKVSGNRKIVGKKLRRDEQLFGCVKTRSVVFDKLHRGYGAKGLRIVNSKVKARIAEMRRCYRDRGYTEDLLRRTVLLAGELAGYEYGEHGLLSYLGEICKAYPQSYCALLGKIMDSMKKEEVDHGGVGASSVTIEIVGLSESDRGDTIDGSYRKIGGCATDSAA